MQMDDKLFDGHHKRQNANDGSDPPLLSRTEPPQLVTSICRHGSGCECCRNIGEGNANVDGGGATPLYRAGVAGYDTDDEDTFQGDHSIDGDEGIGNHHIKVGEHGHIKLRTVMRSLARHEECSCHHQQYRGVLPDKYPEFDSPDLSGRGTPDSMEAVHGSGEHSTSCSALFDHRHANLSDYFDHMSGGTALEDSMDPVLHYPMDLTLDDLSEAEAWEIVT